MEIIIGLVVFFLVGMTHLGLRGSKAADRLQACIDNGMVEYRGGSVLIPDSLPEPNKTKLQNELRWYIKIGRMEPFRNSPNMRLYQRNSIR